MIPKRNAFESFIAVLWPIYDPTIQLYKFQFVPRFARRDDAAPKWLRSLQQVLEPHAILHIEKVSFRIHAKIVPFGVVWLKFM